MKPMQRIFLVAAVVLLAVLVLVGLAFVGWMVLVMIALSNYGSNK
ncbi:hypothetical protein [Fodinicola acaciae]|nr:hypothetical protein [Fodinicola acaciae]